MTRPTPSPVTRTTWRLVLAGVVWLACLVGACGEPDSGTGLTVRATWQQSRGISGHHVHVVEEKVACSACHDLTGEEIDKPTAVSCLGECHEKEAKIDHAREHARQTLGPGAPSDCLQCHAFAPAQVPEGKQDLDPWDCMRCHETDQDDTPAVLVHAQSTCDSCHQPHGDEQVKPSDCTKCHDDIQTAHAAENREPAEVCTTCHQNQHELAEHARQNCQPCHAEKNPDVIQTIDAPAAIIEKAPVIPATALFEGHTECTGCHRPHDYDPANAVTCRSCHQGTPVLGGGRVAAHAACGNCHDAHNVRGAITRACVSCHTSRSTNHPKTQLGEVCSTCHDPHPPAGQASPARACSNCHHAAASDAAFHGSTCAQCHKPHQFVLHAAAGAAAGTGFTSLCKSCHSVAVSGATRVKGHGACKNCHTGLPHRPGTSANCSSAGCHAPVAAKLIAKHKPCGNCHEPHGGGILKTCGSCHDTQLKRAGVGHRTCNSCHDNHAAKAVKGCASCHANKLKAPHATVKGGCESCHSAHGPRGVTFASSCESCHPVAKLPALHTVSKHQACANCHRTHGPAYANERKACTSPCHLDMQNHKPESPRCTGCHLFK